MYYVVSSLLLRCMHETKFLSMSRNLFVRTYQLKYFWSIYRDVKQFPILMRCSEHSSSCNAYNMSCSCCRSPTIHWLLTIGNIVFKLECHYCCSYWFSKILRAQQETDVVVALSSSKNIRSYCLIGIRCRISHRRQWQL
jgi:hypothetical protein